MELSMSMFASQADYWKARAELAETTVRETAEALGCEPDNEAMLAAAADAKRYKWLRDSPATWAPNPVREWLWRRPFGAGEKLDGVLDEAMAERAAVGAA